MTQAAGINYSSASEKSKTLRYVLKHDDIWGLVISQEQSWLPVIVEQFM